MFIRILFARNFRNFDFLDIELSGYRNLILGRNGMGKTNILEAIYMLGYGKSFRGSQDREIVRLGEKEYTVRGDFKKGYEDIRVEINLTNSGKIIRLNEEKLKSLSHIVGIILCVYMGFNDIDIIGGAPKFRRRFLDQSIATVDPIYLDSLKKFLYCLGQRNSLLQGYEESKKLEIDIWNEKLADYGSYIIARRIEYIEFLNKEIKELLDDRIEIRYRLPLTNDPHGDFISESSREEVMASIKESYITALMRNIDREKRLGFTLVGPHRDDFDIIFGGINARLFASLGQMRRIAIILRILQAEYYECSLGEKPIVLMDDIFLEMDSDVSGKVSDIIRGDSQVIATTTEMNKVPESVKWDRVIRFNSEGRPVWN